MKPNVLFKNHRRNWEDKMVIDRLSSLPTKNKIIQCVSIFLTWMLWGMTIFVLLNQGNRILNHPIKFGLDGLDILKWLAIAFVTQLSISLLWTWINRPRPN